MPSQPRTQRSQENILTPTAPAPNHAGPAKDDDRQTSSPPPSLTGESAQDEDEQMSSTSSSPIIHVSPPTPRSSSTLSLPTTTPDQLRAQYLAEAQAPEAPMKGFESERTRLEQERAAFSDLRLKFVLGDERVAAKGRILASPGTPAEISSADPLRKLNWELRQRMQAKCSVDGSETTPSRSYSVTRHGTYPADDEFQPVLNSSPPVSRPTAATPEAEEELTYTPSRSLSQLLALSAELHAGLSQLSQENGVRGKKRRRSS